MLSRLPALVLLLSIAPALFAQTPEGTGVTRYLVTTDHVKPERMDAWRALQQNEVVPALKKAGATGRKVYHTVLGDTTEFASYLPFPDYGEFDGPEALERALGKKEADRLRQRLNECLSASSSRLENSQDYFFFDPGDAPVLFTSSYRTAQGRGNDYMNFLREYMKPPIQRAIDTHFIEGFQVMVTDQGGETGIYILNMFYPDFKQLEQGPPAAKMMNREQLAAFFKAGAGLISPLGQIIRRYESAISF